MGLFDRKPQATPPPPPKECPHDDRQDLRTMGMRGTRWRCRLCGMIGGTA